ncbi:MAG: glycogen synthase GlgA [Clostridia bacterium]|nr:glycogen synthase GlgA [Clostridia bacterium]
MKVLYATSEAAPFLKTGGLGDVLGALPKAVANEGIDARVIMPLYSDIPHSLRSQMEFIDNFYVTISWRKTYCGVFKSTVGQVTYYFIDNEQYFSRNQIYGEYDDSERFAFFSKSVLDVLNLIDFFPDVIHINDWQTSLLPVYLEAFYRADERYRNIKTVLSIHNIEFQGKYNPIILGSIFGLDVNFRSLLMYDGNINLLKGAIETCDMITTVSNTYAQEILHETHSHGLHNILIPRQYKLRGVVNGIDTDVFNPETDSAIVKTYNYDTIRFKSTNKKALQKEMGLEINNDIPVIGMVTRLTTQKGIDLMCEVAHEIEKMDVQLIALGTGDKHFENFFYDWEQRSHHNIRGYIGFSGAMAQKIYAGADLFLMPSKSEPCGLSQLIAMRYGTVPIVHSVGGLHDTVPAYNPQTKEGKGITFQSYNAYDMLDAIRRAVELYKNKPAWRIVRKNAMNDDYSWGEPARKYIEIYSEILSR